MEKLITSSLLLFSSFVFAQKDAQNGDWKSRYVLLQNTSEAAYMVRYGDIDNLGYGWEKGFNPFTGKSTPTHEWPMEKTDSTEINGFDMVMIGSSFTEYENSRDGYCGARGYLMEKFGTTVFGFDIPLKGIDTSKIKSVTIQIFVDDFQPREFGSRFEFYINDNRAAFAEKTLNALAQTGPIGKLITLSVPKEYINEFKKGSVNLKIDDGSTGLGDGFAIDFFKILINPVTIKTSGVKGIVLNADGKPVAKVMVSCGNTAIATNAKGEFSFKNVPAGLALITVTLPDKKEKDFTVDVEEGTETNTQLQLE